MTSAVRRAALLAMIGTALVLLTAAGMAVLQWGLSSDDTRDGLFMAAISLAGMLWLLAVGVVRQGRLPARSIWLVLIVATAMRLITLAGPPLLSSDVYRYVWDGRVELAGINPYRYVPMAPELAFLRDEATYPNISRADYAHTVYAPAAQAVFAFAAAVMPGVFGMKLVMALFDVLAIGALAWLLRIAGRDPAELLIYAWLPLPVWEFAGNAHIDAMAAGLLAVALLLSMRGRVVWSGVVLAAAALTKFLPAVVLLAFWRPKDWRLPLAFAATVVVLYLPYVSIGWRVFGFLGGYASEEGFASGHGFFLLQLLDRITPVPDWGTTLYVVLVLGVLGLLGAWFALGEALPAMPGARVALQTRQAVILGAVLLAALSPHYPWYFAWLAPLACLAPVPSVLWMLAAAPLLAHGAVEHLAVPGAVYGPAAVLAVWDLRRRRVRPASLSPQIARSV